MPLLSLDTTGDSLTAPWHVGGEISIGARELPPSAAVLLRATGVTKSYQRGTVAVPVLRGVELVVRQGELLTIIGQSGSGKSTLLHLLAGLDAVDEGEIDFAGQSLVKASKRHRERLRNEAFGMVFQFYHLLPELSAVENVLLPEWIRLGCLAYWARKTTLVRKAESLLEWVGLAHRRAHRPSELSGGEMQRVAIARALMSEPKLLFADEPTGNLDRQTGAGVMDLLTSLNRVQGLTIVLVTHDASIAQRGHRCVRLIEGRVAED